ncbi:hypothetical protein L1987_59284 [Smallanthus sonchifolius]|uniref:Uncharacterized protein n=1 Tax=Smallanthus sonchifolius TaxID=185202 RepID=A0ACB9D531_9ASTR|nr:hypothetical protein L1987_59284 [Smallanthus sonchifolius]
MGDVLEEDLSTEREMELESIAFSTHPPFVSSDLTTLTTSHFTRICSKHTVNCGHSLPSQIIPRCSMDHRCLVAQRSAEKAPSALANGGIIHVNSSSPSGNVACNLS